MYKYDYWYIYCLLLLQFQFEISPAGPLDKCFIFIRDSWITGVHRNGFEINLGRH